MSHSEPWLDDPLGHVIGAGRVAHFFEHIYEREALIALHNEPARFAGLLSIEDVDRVVTNFDLKQGQLSLADATQELSSGDFVDDAGYIDRGAVADLYRRGATIILNQAHQFTPSLARLCRGLEHAFSSHVQTNTYLTPPNAQGFRTHYDNHDVLVIQVAGEKAWRLYDKPIDTPFRGEGFEPGKYEAGEVKQEFVLKAGDCAYVPRGLMHDAMTSGEHTSLHVTVGLITRTWADLMLEAVSEAALRSPELRRSLPAGFAQSGFNRDAARKHFAELTQIVAREAQLDPALDLMVDTFIRSRGANNTGAVLHGPRGPGKDDRFQAKPSAPFRIAEDAGDVVVVCPGGELTFAAEALADVQIALSGKIFMMSDIKSAKPDAIVASLLAYGLVQRV